MIEENTEDVICQLLLVKRQSFGCTKKAERIIKCLVKAILGSNAERTQRAEEPILVRSLSPNGSLAANHQSITQVRSGSRAEIENEDLGREITACRERLRFKSERLAEQENLASQTSVNEIRVSRESLGSPSFHRILTATILEETTQ